MTSLLNLANTPRPINEGDAGIVLPKEGDFYVFSTGAIDPENMTDRQIEQGRVLLAFSVALKIPRIMEVLFRMSEDPVIAGSVIDLGTTH